jgi:hypothetical protein
MGGEDLAGAEEERLVRAFVVPARRERLVQFLANPKRRAQATAALAHFGDLDPRWVVALPKGAQDPVSIERELRRRGAGDTCHVVSENRQIDGARLALGAALELVVGRGLGTLLSCVPGSLAYFEGEGPSDRCLLLKRAR